MEIILNLLPLTREQQDTFLAVSEGHVQRFAGPGDISTLGRDILEDVTVIIGNPSPAAVQQCPRLKWLQTQSAGTEQYEAPGVLPEGAVLTNASGAYGHAVAEHMFAMLLALMKRLPGYRDAKGSWEDLGVVKTLEGAMVLVLGTGDLGSSFAVMCKAMGARTVGIRRHPEKTAAGIDAMYGMDALDVLLPQADTVCLMLPHSPETAGLLDKTRLQKMKRDAILLNGGRGSAIDLDALTEVLAAGHLWGAGLDVTDPEPLPPEHPLWRQPRALITPHTAGGSHLPEIAPKIRAIALARLQRYLASGGESPV